MELLFNLCGWKRFWNLDLCFSRALLHSFQSKISWQILFFEFSGSLNSFEKFNFHFQLIAPLHVHYFKWIWDVKFQFCDKRHKRKETTQNLHPLITIYTMALSIRKSKFWLKTVESCIIKCPFHSTAIS